MLMIFAIGLTGLGVANLVVRYEVSNVSAVKVVGVGVFWDRYCFVKVTQINWGVLEPGRSAMKTVYVRSDANVLITLTIFAENWKPSECDQYITLETPITLLLEPQKVNEVSLRLTIAQKVTGITDFSFDIIFAGGG